MIDLIIHNTIGTFFEGVTTTTTGYASEHD